MNFLLNVPNELHARLEVIKTTRSLRMGKRVYLKDLYLEAINLGIRVMQEETEKGGLQNEKR